jgi:hypothetical protein
MYSGTASFTHLVDRLVKDALQDAETDLIGRLEPQGARLDGNNNRGLRTGGAGSSGRLLHEKADYTCRSLRYRCRMRTWHQAEFVAGATRSLENARRTGDYVDAEAVVRKLQRKLDAARARKPLTRR